jgi:transcriptional regulator with XRE-family HTH domain
MALGERIRFYRHFLAWTLEDLSVKSQVDVGTISALEARKSKVSKYAPQIASAFGLTLDQLLDEEHNWLEKTAKKPLPTQATPLPTRSSATWPFAAIDPRKINRLSRDDLLRLEGAMLSIALQLGVDIRKQAAA